MTLNLMVDARIMFYRVGLLRTVHRLFMEIRSNSVVETADMAEETVAEFNVEDYDEEADIKLAKQDLKTLDVTTLTPLSHQVISRQATINIGTCGRSVCLSHF